MLSTDTGQPKMDQPIVSTSLSSDSVQAEAWSNKDWQCLFLVAALALVCFLPWLGSYGIIDPSDGYYSEAAREMVTIGNYLTPHLNYAPFFEKPILIYWLISASYKMFGISEWAARLPSALSSVGLVALTFAFSRQFVRRRIAVMAALILLTSPLLLVVGHMSLTDAPLAFLTWIAFAGFFVGLNNKSTVAICLAYVGLGLAILCKGPIALLFVAMNFIAYVAVTAKDPKAKKTWLDLVKQIKPLWGLVILLAIALPWYLTESIATNGAFFQEFFIRQNIGRALGVVNHKAAIWFYLPVLVAGFFPWTMMLAYLRGCVKESWLNRLKPSEQDKLTLFTSIAALIMFVFFSVVSAKMATYLLPVIPALAIVAASGFDTIIVRQKEKLLSLSAIFLLLVCLAGALVIFILKNKVPANLMAAIPLLLLMSIGFAIYGILAYKKQLSRAVVVLMATMTAGSAAAIPIGMNALYDGQQSTFQQVITYAKDNHIQPIVFGRYFPSAMFYLHCRVPFYRVLQDFTAYLAQTKAPQYVIVHYKWQKKFDQLPATKGLIFKNDRYSLYLVSNLDPVLADGIIHSKHDPDSDP
jgi:4-amino-4-deoxy-L-arabinose transferase-like glycosyltransferase